MKKSIKNFDVVEFFKKNYPSLRSFSTTSLKIAAPSLTSSSVVSECVILYLFKVVPVESSKLLRLGIVYLLVNCQQSALYVVCVFKIKLISECTYGFCRVQRPQNCFSVCPDPFHIVDRRNVCSRPIRLDCQVIQSRIFFVQ